MPSANHAITLEIRLRKLRHWFDWPLEQLLLLARWLLLVWVLLAQLRVDLMRPAQLQVDLMRLAQLLQADSIRRALTLVDSHQQALWKVLLPIPALR